MSKQNKIYVASKNSLWSRITTAELAECCFIAAVSSSDGTSNDAPMVMVSWGGYWIRVDKFFVN